MTKTEMISWIEQASYEDMLRKVRFDPIGSPWFIGSIWELFMVEMNKKKRALPDGAAVAASKRIGWDRP